MKTVSSKTPCIVYKGDKEIAKGPFGPVCKMLFAHGIIQCFPDKCFTKLDNKTMTEDWSKIAHYMDELLEEGFTLELQD